MRSNVRPARMTIWIAVAAAAYLLVLILAGQPSVAAQEGGIQETVEPNVIPTPQPTVAPTTQPPPPPVDWSKAQSPHLFEPTPARPEQMPAEPEGPRPQATPRPPKPPADQPAGQGTYIVQSGDNLYRIALRLGVSITALANANSLVNPSLIYPGQVLVVPGDGAAPPAAGVEVQEAVAASDTYVVQSGDSLFKIARRFGKSVPALAAANSIANPNVLYVGQVLQIPEGDVSPLPPPAPTAAATVEIPDDNIYVVQRGDTLYDIARRFGTTAMALVTANNITNPNSLQVGQRLLLAMDDGTPAAPPPATTTPAATPPPAPSEPPPSGPFIWPVESRRIVKYYSYYHPGIDIVDQVGSAIVASAAGTVEFAGWNQYGYGYLVVLDHGNGLRTLYAHHSELLVETGQTVEQGQVIALMGSTGRSNMPHVHLEIIYDTGKENPCRVLPGGC